MTPVDKDDFEDAELARRLAALPQPEPSAELDAAIFAQIQKDLAPGPAAANDPATAPPRPSLLRRYRAPLAFAASLAGIAILLPVWRSNQPLGIYPVETKIVEAPAPLPAPAIINDEAAAPADKKRESAIAPAKPAPPMPQLEMPAQAPEAVVAAPPPAPVPAPAPAAAPPAPSKEVDELDPPRKAAAGAIEPENPKDWLQSIERMLDDGDTNSAAAQWKRFRKAHPDYPVPDTLAGRLKALE